MMSFSFLLCLSLVASTESLPPRRAGRTVDLPLLQDLTLGPLGGRSIFLIHDEQSSREVNLDQVLRSVSAVTSLVATQEGFLKEQYPTDCVRGDNNVMMLLFSASPTSFLDSLADSSVWNPSFLILLTTNRSLNTTQVLGHPLVQRSRHIVMFEPTAGDTSIGFQMSTSYPFRSRGLRSTLGVWNKTSVTSVKDLFPDRHPNFQGEVLHLGSWCDDYPFIYASDDDCIGSNLDILSAIADRLNFTYVVQWKTQDHNWGALEDGRWTGMLGDLVYNGKHIVINLFIVNHERWRDFDITDPYYTEGFGFLSRQPLPAPRWRSLTYPFAGVLWLTIIMSSGVVSLVFSVLVSGFGREGDFDVFQHITVVCAGVVRQPVSVDGLARVWQRVWLGLWWLACLILTAAYTCNLIAFLTVPVYTARPETVSQIATSDLRVAMMDYGNFLPEALKQSSDPDLLTMGHKMDLIPYIDDYFAGISAVMNRTHALTETFSYLSNVQIQYNVTHDTYLMKEQVYSGYVSWFLPKNTPYTHKISTLLTRLREGGIVDKFYHNHFLQVSKTAGLNEGTRTLALSVGHLQGAFLLLVLGVAVSVFVLTLETLFSLVMTSN
ncbi:glutamate receptor ionotropic, NMDA 3B-like [Panulirus ornatus]|uniref:glutamate receptor ionotropic, NMDA 3B-like n=1 Tax=Panulirus ornatus TaxID=150431 RepID=UPI003A88EF44